VVPQTGQQWRRIVAATPTPEENYFMKKIVRNSSLFCTFSLNLNFYLFNFIKNFIYVKDLASTYNNSSSSAQSNEIFYYKIKTLK
jgi:hypothetical protein